MAFEMYAASRKRIYGLLESGAEDLSRPNRWLSRALIVLIVLNVVSVVLETVPAIYAVFGAFFDAFDLFSVIVFSIEYVARVWTCVEASVPDREPSAWARMQARARYIFSPLSLIDLLAILPFYLQWALLLDLRVLRVLRLLRVFKVTRYFPALSVLLEVLRQELRSIGAVLSLLALAVVLAASLSYLFEHPVQPDVFPHIPAAMYWAVITLTTVGYGDMVPLTPMGKALGAVIAIIGVGMVALPAGILSSAFSEKLSRSRKHYEAEVSHALEDGLITDEEKSQLDILRDDLGLSEEDAEATLRAVVAQRTHVDGVYMQTFRAKSTGKAQDKDLL